MTVEETLRWLGIGRLSVSSALSSRNPILDYDSHNDIAPPDRDIDNDPDHGNGCGGSIVPCPIRCRWHTRGWPRSQSRGWCRANLLRLHCRPKPRFPLPAACPLKHRSNSPRRSAGTASRRRGPFPCENASYLYVISWCFPFAPDLGGILWKSEIIDIAVRTNLSFTIIQPSSHERMTPSSPGDSIIFKLNLVDLDPNRSHNHRLRRMKHS